MILVVGATGQLGTLVVRRLQDQGRPVRALVRPGSAGIDALGGAELAYGDLRDPGGLGPALAGVDAVVATANAVAPSRKGDSAAAMARGYTELVTLAAAAGVRRFVLASAAVSDLDEAIPDLRLKRLVERRLAGSAVSGLSVRMAPFTEIWLSLVGSSLPDRGELNPTLRRPYPFLQQFRRRSGRTIEDHGLLVLPGPAANRQAFLSIHDAAAVLTDAVDSPDTGAVDVGGPQVLSWNDVAAEFEAVLGRPVRVLSVPAATFRVARAVLAPVAPAAAGVMGLNLLIATTESPWPPTRPGLRTVREVLAAKAALPE